ncbi:MAG TPA: M23 family metallopeptidase [Rudaea sp.]|nr:M23 family metallopeptidase [Rudaea sp.]
MNIIIVAKPHATPTTLDLKCWRVRMKLALVSAACALLFAFAGFAAAMFFASPRDRALSDMRALHGEILAQRKGVAKLETASRRDLDALALKLGELEAQATRLNALGQRLAQVGKLDDGEFDFKTVPAMGGAEDPNATSHPLTFDLAGNIANLRQQFDREETELTVLEDLLLDRKVDNALLPSGYPVATGYIGSGFGERTDPINGESEHHLGIDFDAAPGTEIKAVAEGVVTWNGERPGYGNVVEIDHGNGYMTRYAHNQKNLVGVGERVHAGQVIARVGSTGRATGPHCHFEVWLNGRAVNPLTYVNGTVKRT